MARDMLCVSSLSPCPAFVLGDFFMKAVEFVCFLTLLLDVPLNC